MSIAIPPRATRTRRGDLAWLLAAGLVVNALAARLITHPGYVDAYYYFGGAKELARGQGLTELYLWNYLAAGLPGVGLAPPWPSHLYWMPLTSLVAAPFMAAAEALPSASLANDRLFRAAQVPFIVLASALPLLTYAVAERLGGQRRHAVAAAWLTLLSPFYFIYWSTTDAFALHALAASGAMVAALKAGEGGPRRRGWALAAGVCAGLAHLARADGLLVLLVAAAWLLWTERRRGLVLAALLLGGYMAVMAPWFGRNLIIVGRPLAGGTQTLWLREYDELFSYPAANLTPAHLLAGGWGTVLQGKWAAVRDNLIALAVVQGGIVALPVALAGLWRARGRALARVGAVYGLSLLALMSLAFTFPGPRGGFFHSGAALLPWLMGAAPLGLDAAVEAAARRLPHWQPDRSKPIFTALLVLATAVMAAAVFSLRVVGRQPGATAWDRQDQVYVEAAAWMKANGAADSLVVVNNPPGWTYWSARPGIVTPNGDTGTLVRVMDDYQARWLLLDRNRPAGLAGLYAAPEAEPRLRLLATFGGQGPAPTYLLERSP